MNLDEEMARPASPASSPQTIPSAPRTIVWTAVWGISYQIVAALVQFIALGFLIRLVGREQFGLWMLIYALTAWMPLLTFGQGNVLLTRFGQTVFSDFSEARRILSASLSLVLLTSGVALLLLLVLAPLVPWVSWLSIGDPAVRAQALPTAIGAIAAAIASAPMSLSNSALIASRRGVFNHRVMVATQLLGLAVFLIGVWARWPLWALGTVIVAPLSCAGMALFLIGVRWGYLPRPAIGARDVRSIKMVAGLGLTIFPYDLTTIFLQRTPELFVAHYRGLGELAAFGAANRLSVFVLAIMQAILIPTWPTISEAASKGNWGFVKRGLLSSLAVVLLIWAAASTGIWFVGPFLIEKWTGVPNLVSGALLIAIILQSFGQALQSWLFTGLSALSLYRTQLLAVIGAVLIYFALTLLLGQPFGVVGIVLAQLTGLLLFALPVGLFAVARCIRRRGSIV